MAMIAFCSLLIGAALGGRCRVLALFPVALAGAALVAVASTLKAAPLSSALIAVVVWTIPLQLGYLCGLLARYCLEVSGLVSQRALPSPVVRS
jgi:hypothetical protein